MFVPAVRTPKLPYLCAGAECVTCKRPVSGDWGLVPDECDTCDAERRARYYRECAQWADDEIARLTARNAELVKALDDTESERLLRALAGALSKAFISTWQSTAYWAGELDEALEWIKKQDERAALKGDATP